MKFHAIVPFVAVQILTVSAAQMNLRRRTNRLVSIRRDAHARRDVIVPEDSVLPEMDGHNRQSGEHHADISILILRIGHQLVAIPLTDRVRRRIAGIVIRPCDAHALRRSLRKERKLRPVRLTAHAKRAVKRPGFRVIAHLVLAAAHGAHQLFLCLAARVLNSPYRLYIQHGLHPDIRLPKRFKQFIHYRRRIVLRASVRKQARQRYKQRRRQQHRQHRAQQISSAIHDCSRFPAAPGHHCASFCPSTGQRSSSTSSTSPRLCSS